MISPSTNKTVRIYPLENITRWEVRLVFKFYLLTSIFLLYYKVFKYTLYHSFIHNYVISFREILVQINEPSIFTFWAKSAVDIEPRRIRLKSGSYTTNAILDTLTAACVQVCLDNLGIYLDSLISQSELRINALLI